MTHTPGPWIVPNDCRFNEDVPILDARGFCIARIEASPILDNYSEKLNIDHWAMLPGESFIDLPEGEIEANARLTASAPCLLRALKGLMDDIDTAYLCVCPDKEKTCRFCVARAAITKSTGKG